MEIRIALKRGEYKEKSPDTIKKIMKELLEEKEHELKANSMLRAKETFKIVSEMKLIADKPIQQVTAKEIKTDLLKLVDPNGKYNYSQSYIDKIYSMIRSVYDKAVEDDIINMNNNLLRNGKVKKPKSSKKDKEIKPFNREECKLFLIQLEQEDDEYKNVYYVLIYTGMRVRRMSSH